VSSPNDTVTGSICTMGHTSVLRDPMNRSSAEAVRIKTNSVNQIARPVQAVSIVIVNLP
jgi:hypothetical protein